VTSLHYFYPGDSVVECIGVYVFHQFYPWANSLVITMTMKHRPLVTLLVAIKNKFKKYWNLPNGMTNPS
jgi:hypothetical protein